MKQWYAMLRPGCDMPIVCSVDPERDSMLDWFYSRIDCRYIECVPIAPNGEFAEPLVMIIDEEGMLKELEINVYASQLYIMSGGRSVIVGTALIGQQIIRGDEPDIGGFDTSDQAMQIAQRLMRCV